MVNTSKSQKRYRREETYIGSGLLTVRNGGNTVGIGHLDTVGSIVDRDVGIDGILEQHLFDVLRLQEWQQGGQPRLELLLGVNISHCKESSFGAVVADEQTLPVDLPLVELLRRYALNIVAIGDGKEGPSTVEAACSHLDAGLLKRLRILLDKTLEDALVRVAVGGAVEAASLSGKGVVRLRGFEIPVIELERQVRTGGDDILEQRRAQ